MTWKIFKHFGWSSFDENRVRIDIQLFQGSVNIRKVVISDDASRVEDGNPLDQFFFSSSGSNYFSFSTLPYIRSTKATNWIPTVTYKRAPAISSTRIFILSYYLISPVTRINVLARVLANCRDTAHSPLINLSPRPVLRNATWNNFEITSIGIYIPFAITTVLCLLGFSKVSFVVYGFLGFLLFQHQL